MDDERLDDDGGETATTAAYVRRKIHAYLTVKVTFSILPVNFKPWYDVSNISYV